MRPEPLAVVVSTKSLHGEKSAARVTFGRRRGERVPSLESVRDAFSPENRDLLLDSERWPAEMLARLCAAALHAGIERDYVLQLIRKRRLKPAGPDALHWPWPIRIYTLGRFSLVKDGSALTFQGKYPRKPLDMLRVLIALGGREVRTSAVTRALWSEDESVDLRKLFDNTLHRLRSILGEPGAVLLHDAKLTLDSGHCWVDAWAYDSITGQLCRGESIEPHLADVAREMYQNHFLSGEADESWLLPYRERLRNRYHCLALSDGLRLEAAGQWEAAARIYEHAIEIDNLAEILYRRLMVCWQQRGESAEVLRVYRRCRDLLSIVLGVKPSRETEAIRQQVKDA